MAIKSWGSSYTTGGGGTESGKPIKQLGGFSAAGPAPYVPGSGGDTAPSSGATPGTYDIGIFDPIGSAAQARQETEDGIAGLKNALFGTSQPDAAGQHGGLVGDVPLVGPLLRAGSETIANAAGAVGTAGKAVLDTVGGGLEHIDLGSDETHREVQAKFDQLPDGVEKQAALAAIKNDPGATGHYMALAVKQVEQAKITEGLVDHPDFTTGAFHTPGSAAEAVDNILGAFGLTARLAERSWTELQTPGQGWMDRLQIIKAVGDGQFAFNEDKGILGTGLLAGDPTAGLNPIEQIAYKKTKDGAWTDAEARDFLAANNAGYSHSAAANIAGNVALDPQNLASLGAAGIAKIGTTGAKLVAATAKAEQGFAKTEALLNAAKVAGDVEKVALLTDQLAQDAKLIRASEMAMRVEKTATKLNPLGKLAESQTATDIVRNLYKTYEPLQQMHVDKALKVARAVVDPLSAFSLRNPLRKQMVDLMTDDGVKSVIGAYGDIAHAQVVHALTDAAPNGLLADMFSEDIGTYSANLIRRVIARKQRQIALSLDLGDELVNTKIEDAISQVDNKVPKSYNEYILREANAHRIRAWDDVAKTNLAERLADNYAIKSTEEWLDWMKKTGLNEDQLSLLHAATYGRATKRLLAAVTESKKGTVGKLGDKVNRLILINRNTLTKQGAEGAVADLKAYVDKDLALDAIEALQAQYPELRGFTLDRTANNTIDRFVKELERRKDALPSQVLQDELAELPDDLASLHTDKTYTLGFAPEDEFKWGLERSNDAAGKYAPVYDVWVDHVAPGMAMGYRSVGRLVEQNIAGQPIIGAAGKQLARGIDYIDAGIHTMGRRISGTVIAESARNTFVQRAAHKYGDVGITQKVAKEMITALEEAAGASDIVVRPSGLTTKNMWAAVEDIIPKGIAKQDFDRRDLLNLVLEAYQGDMRYVGLTQALSSRIKRVLAFDSNNASVLAEQAYPTLKYRINVIFQSQEKGEPWILNAMRGVTPARTVSSMNDADKATMVLLEKMAQHSLVTNADYEMAEYAGQLLHGKTLEEYARSSTGPLGRMTNKLGVNWEAIRDVKGVKQLNMLRTFRKGLAKDMKNAWEMHSPGMWDDMYMEAQRKAGKGLLDEDEFAVGLMGEQMLGSGVSVTTSLENRLKGVAGMFDKVEYKSAIKPGEWMRPQTLGELKPLDLDSMAELMAFPTGEFDRVTKTQADIRAAIASGHLSIEDVKTALRRMNADPDYIARVENALTFSWTGFWDQVKADFKISPARSRELQDFIANGAAMRNMTPIDYLSQIISPSIVEGRTEALMGHLGKVNDILGPEGRVMGQSSDLARLGVEVSGTGTEDQFVNQLASIFTAHLDPSAKKGLLQAFFPDLRQRVVDGELDLNTAEIERIWAEQGGDSVLAQHIMDQVQPDPLRWGDIHDAGLLRTVEDFDRLDPPQAVHILDINDQPIKDAPLLRFLGDGVRGAEPEVRGDVLRMIGRLRAEYPDIDSKLRHIDIISTADMAKFDNPGADLSGVAGMTVDSEDGGFAIFLNKHVYGTDEFGTTYAEQKAMKADAAERNRYRQTFKWQNHIFNVGYDAPRESVYGTSFLADNTPQGIVTHEVGHVLDLGIDQELTRLQNQRRAIDLIGGPSGKGIASPKSAREKELQKYIDFRDRFQSSAAHRRLSEYAHNPNDERDMMAELLGIVLSGKDPKVLDAATQEGFDALMAGGYRSIRPSRWTSFKQATDWYDNLILLDAERFYSPSLEDALNALDMADNQVDFEDALEEVKRLGKNVERRWNKVKDQYIDETGGGLRAIDPSSLKGPQSVDEAVTELKQLLQDMGKYNPAPVNAGANLAPGAVGPVVPSSNPDVIRATQMFGKWTTGVMAEGLKRGGDASQASTLEKIAAIPTHQAVPYNFTEARIMDSVVEAMRSKWDDAHRLQYYSRERSMFERSLNHPMFGIYPASYMWGKMLPEIIRFATKEPFGIRTGAAAYSMVGVQRNIALQREFDPEFDKGIEKIGHSPAMFALGYMMPSWPWEASAAWPGWTRELSQEGLDMQARAEAGGYVSTDSSSNGINIPQIAQKATDVMNPVKALDRTIFAPIEDVTNPQAQPTSDTGQYYMPGDTGPVAAGDLGATLSNEIDNLRALLGG